MQANTNEAQFRDRKNQTSKKFGVESRDSGRAANTESKSLFVPTIIDYDSDYEAFKEYARAVLSQSPP